MSEKTKRKNKVILSRPGWPTEDPFWKFWNLLHEYVKQKYSKECVVEVFRVSPGLSGKKQIERYIVENKNHCNLIFAHHIDKRFEKSIDYKMSYFPELFYFGNEGYNAFSNICNKDLLSKDLGQKTYDSFYDQRISKCINQTKYFNDNTSSIEKNIPDKFLFIPLQVENDTVMKHKSIQTTQLIDHAIRVSKQLGVPLVVKTHPKAPKNNNVIRGVRSIINQNSNCFISNGDVRQLLDRSIGVMTISSGVGFEALIRFKHVFTYGKCDYQQISNPNSTITQVCKILNQPVNENLTKQFLYHWWEEIVDTEDENLFQKFDIKIQRWLNNEG